MRQRALLLLVLGLGIAWALWSLADDADEFEPTDSEATAPAGRPAALQGAAARPASGTETGGVSAPTAGEPGSDSTVPGGSVPGPKLRGRVVDEAGAAVPGVQLKVTLQATEQRDGRKGGGWRAPADEVLVTDARGGFELGTTHATGCIIWIHFIAVPRRFLWPSSRRFAFRNEPLELTLFRGASIAGRVLPHPALGQARALQVSAYWLEGGAPHSIHAREGDTDTFFGPRSRQGTSRGATHARVDTAGRFEFFGLPPDARVDLIATPAFKTKPMTIQIEGRTQAFGPARAAYRSDAIGVAHDIEVGRDDVEIVLGGGGAGVLEITAVDENSAPLAEQGLLIRATLPSALPERRVQTSAQGTAVVPGLAAGTHEVQVLNWITAPRRVMQTVRLPSGPVRLTFAPATKRRIHGELVGAGSLAGFRVKATGASLKKALVVLVDAEGRFQLQTFADHVDLRAERFADDRCAHLHGVIPGGEAVRLVLQPGASIEGRVFDVDGRPLRAEGWARAFNEQVSVRTAIPGGGRFRLDGLPPGRYTVQAGGGTGPVPAELSGVEAGRTGLELRIPEQR